MPDPRKLLHTLDRAADAFRTTPGRLGRFVQLANADEILVAGDVHGNLANFKKLLDMARLPEHPRRHLVVQEVIHGPDRYPDGGDNSHRLLDLIAALKVQFPDRVHMLIGNHELSQWTGRAILKNDDDLNQLFRLGVDTAYGPDGEAIYQAYLRLFAAMPVALRTSNRVFLSHSLPAANRLDQWELDQLFTDEVKEEDIKLGGAIHAVAWGRDLSEETAQRFLAKVECDLLITGHIPCDAGYQFPNSRQLILDSKDANAHVCLFSTQTPLTRDDLVAGLRRL